MLIISTYSLDDDDADDVWPQESPYGKEEENEANNFSNYDVNLDDGKDYHSTFCQI